MDSKDSGERACKLCSAVVEPDFLGGWKPVHLEDGICFQCWRMLEGVVVDYRSRFQRYLDELV